MLLKLSKHYWGNYSSRRTRKHFNELKRGKYSALVCSSLQV
uniref:Uncharacterized protein n=1 Tax=Arundo donax TaxID=35708 RepID=A0A0A9A3L3_ARUDO